MLIYLKEVDQIINTDSIESVNKSEYTNKYNSIDESFLNLKPDENIPELESEPNMIDIHMRNGYMLSLNTTVEEFWNLIQSYI